MIQEVEAMAATMDAFEGTALMPYQHKVDVDSNVNVQGNVDVNQTVLQLNLNNQVL